MKKIKDMWKNNKVLIVLGLILFVCLIAILVVMFSYFLGGNKDEYGDRLKDISKYPVTEEVKNEYVNSLENDKIVDSVKLNIQGRIIYITINYVLDVNIDDAKSKAEASLKNFNEDILSYYDIMFTIKCSKSENSDGFTLLGAKNVAGSGLVWNNNTPVESDEK